MCVCECVCALVCERRRRRRGIPHLNQSQSLLVFIVSSCCSIRRFGWPVHICPSLPPSCDSNVVSWKHASTHSVWRIKRKKKKITNPLRADSLGILPPILLLLLFARLRHPRCVRTVTLLTKSCFYVRRPAGTAAGFITKHYLIIFLSSLTMVKEELQSYSLSPMYSTKATPYKGGEFWLVTTRIVLSQLNSAK